MSRGEIAGRLLRLLRPLIPMMTFSTTARVVNQGLGVLIPSLAALVVVGSGPGSSWGAFLALLAGLALVKGAFRYLEQFTGHAIAFRLLAELRIDTYRNIAPLAPAGLEDDRTGDLVSRAIGDIDRVEPFFAHTIAPLVSAVAVPALTAIGMALWIDPVLALTFIPFPLLMLSVVPWIRARRVAAMASKAREQGGETTAVFTDAVQGAREIAIFDARSFIAARIADRSAASASIRRGLARVSAARVGLGDLIAGGAVVAMALVAAGRYETGLIGLPGLAAAMVVSWVGTTPARAVEDIVPDLEQALASAARLFDLADREPPVAPPTGVDAQPADGSIAFRDVGVHFNDNAPPALQDVDLEIDHGSYVAIVGPSGSGKSTLVELLVRFRDPARGRLLLGGVSIDEIEPALLRETTMLVPQRPDIYYGTIADNLLLAGPGASPEKLLEALDRAALGTWVRSLEKGLETPVGELGGALSGGQRQRLSIARAFLRDPKVLILDEATSELDVATERLVLDQIARERGRRTVAIVAHRLESIIGADEIFVIDRGRLVERGTHAALSAGNGVYSGLWQRHLDVIPNL